ncbi:ArsB/NhaD family transporter [Paenibacillus sp. GCM10027628]|uniref:ArsB/NhaD family transporter n=1 Tax=Paenibacillus sp. GCM10027628 TaxID=3273413 RepID=UPI00363D2793
MLDTTTAITLSIFMVTLVFLLWRPWGMNESIPPAIGAAIILLAGIVPFSDMALIYKTVSGAIITIISTIVMSIVLDSIGFFRWTAYNLVVRAKGSGKRLYWYVTLLCFLMTLFFNNDGSILITTPIIIYITTLLDLNMRQKLPYLVSGALVATASSAPIGVSNLANLIAMKIVGLDLNSYAVLMFVPAMVGIGSISLMLYFYFRKDIPREIRQVSTDNTSPSYLKVPRAYYDANTVTRMVQDREVRKKLPPQHRSPSTPHSSKEEYRTPPPSHLAERRHGGPLKASANDDLGIQETVDWRLFRISIGIVILIRLGFFVGSSLGISIEWIAITGALLLIALRWYFTGRGVKDLLKKTPWHTLLFAFSIYVVVYALHNVGMTAWMVNQLKGIMTQSEFHTVMGFGLLLTIMSTLLNNLPSVMIGTLALTEMGLDTHSLQIAYLANIIGSDIGSLITPMGTLASLMWMFILRKNNLKITWTQYIKITIVIIPLGLIISLLSLYVWIRIIR